MPPVLLTRQPLPLRFVGERSVKDTMFAAVKPCAVPMYSHTLQGQVKGRSGSYEAAVGTSDRSDVEDCFYHRLVDSAVPSSTERSSAEGATTFYTPTFNTRKLAASPTPWGRGLQLCLQSVDDFAFLRNCVDIGLVEREYLVLVHAPMCLSTSRQRKDDDELLLTAGDTEKDRSSKAITNPFVRREIAKQKEQERLAKRENEATPSCIARHPTLHGFYRSSTLTESGEITAYLTLRSANRRNVSGGDSNETLKRVTSLFTTATASSATLAGTRCGGHRGTECKGNRCCSGVSSLPRHPWLKDSELLTVVTPSSSSSLSIRKSLLPGKSSSSAPASPLGKSLVRSSFRFSLLRHNPLSALALYSVSTNTASEEELRAIFAAAGLPVVCDWQYNIPYTRALWDASMAAQKSGSSSPTQKSGRKGPMSVYRETLRSPGSVPNDGTLSELGQQNTGTGTPSVGLGIACVGLTVPEVQSHRNESVLSTVLTTAFTAGQHTIERFGPAKAEQLAVVKRQMKFVRFPTKAEDHSFFRVVDGSWDGDRSEEGAPLSCVLCGGVGHVPFQCGRNAKTLPVHDETTVGRILDSDQESVINAIAKVELPAAPGRQIALPSLDDARAAVHGSASLTRLQKNVSPFGAPAGEKTNSKGLLYEDEDGNSGRHTQRRCQICGGRHETEECTKGLRQQGSDAAARTNTKEVVAAMKADPSSFFCILCGELGHWYPFCRSHPRVGLGNACPLCRERGTAHAVEDCPARFPSPKGFLKSGIHCKHQHLIKRKALGKGKPLFRELH